MNIQLSDHFTYSKLFRFTFPSIVMIVFTSIYSVVDGFFVSNYVGKTPFAALNLIMPFLMILGAVGFMIGTGGSALVAMSFGQGEDEKANRIFSLLIYLVIGTGIVFSTLGIVFLEPIARILGASDDMLPYCVQYGRIILLALVPFMLQNVFQSFLVTAEKPTLGLFITLAAGITNMILDWLFMAVFSWGIVGAASATAVSQVIGGFIPLIYFTFPNKSKLRLGKTRIDKKAIIRTCTNGSSEFLSNISLSLTSMLYNIRLIQLAGENGVSIYGVLMYVNFIFIAVFIGFSVGTAPIVGYHHGADNHEELKSFFKKSLIIISTVSVSMFVLAEVFAVPLSSIFVGYDDELMQMTVSAFRICSFMFIFCGINIFGSAFFTALNNGFISALISFGRTLVFQVICVLLLPQFFGLSGLWLSVVIADVLSLVVTIICLIKYKGKYHYT